MSFSKTRSFPLFVYFWFNDINTSVTHTHPLFHLSCPWKADSIREKYIWLCHVSSICLPLVPWCTLFYNKSACDLYMSYVKGPHKPLKSRLFPSLCYVLIQNIQCTTGEYLLRLNLHCVLIASYICVCVCVCVLSYLSHEWVWGEQELHIHMWPCLISKVNKKI